MAEAELVTMKVRARQYVMTLTRVRRKQDDLHQTMEQLCSKRGVARNKRDRANQEHDAAQQ